MKQRSLAIGSPIVSPGDMSYRGWWIAWMKLKSAELEKMPNEQKVANNSQTYLADAETFEFETIEQENGQATVVRFKLDDPRIHAGDVLLVLSGTDIHFHGMIGQLEEGYAVAADRRGSLLPATVQ